MMWLRIGRPNMCVHMGGWHLEQLESFLPGRGKERDLLAYLKQSKIWDNGFQDAGHNEATDIPKRQKTQKLSFGKSFQAVTKEESDGPQLKETEARLQGD